MLHRNSKKLDKDKKRAFEYFGLNEDKSNSHFKLFKPIVFSDIFPIILYTFLLFFYRFIEAISET